MTDETDLPSWHKSSASGHTACVEVQFDEATVRVRSSRSPECTLEFTADEWDAFLFGARAGEFERRTPFAL